MVEAAIITALVGSLVALPLAWRAWRDRSEDRALAVHAEIDGAARHALGGESLLSIDVVAAEPWRRGRVVLTAPAHWEWMIEAVVKDVLERMPAEYDLVVPSTGDGRALADRAPLRLAA